MLKLARSFFSMQNQKRHSRHLDYGKVSSQYQVTIPKIVRARYGLQKNDRVSFFQTDCGLVICRVPKT